MKTFTQYSTIAAAALLASALPLSEATKYKCRSTQSGSSGAEVASSSGTGSSVATGSSSTVTSISSSGSYSNTTSTGSGGSAWDWKKDKSYGVNIGNWLVLEAWMDSNWFNSVANGGTDEWGLSQNLGKEKAAEVLTAHWNSWLKEDDVAGLAKQGINMLRVPVGFWAFIGTQGDEPYVTSGQKAQLERILGYAAKYNMYIIVDLHGLPGSQNGNDHSGHAGSIDFYTADNQKRSVETVEAVVAWAQTVANKDRIAAIQSANEPKANSDADFATLKDFYTKANTIINNAGWPMMFHDAFRGTGAWNDFLTNGESAILDVHPYWAFSGHQTEGSVIGGVCAYGSQFKNFHLPVFAGEFSVAATDVAGNPSWYRKFYDSQISQWTQSAGGTFWSFKAVGSDPWSLQSLISQGAIPSDPKDTSQSAC